MKRLMSLFLAMAMLVASVPQQAFTVYASGDGLGDEPALGQSAVTDSGIKTGFADETGLLEGASLPDMEYVEGMPYVGFKSKQAVLPEKGEYTLAIGRTGDTDIPTEILLKTVDVSASYGKDYVITDDRFSTEVQETHGTLLFQAASDEAISQAKEDVAQITDQIMGSVGDDETDSSNAENDSGISEEGACASPSTASAKLIDEKNASLAELKAAQSGLPVRETTEDAEFIPITEDMLNEFNIDVSEQVEVSSITRVVFGAGETEQTVRVRILDDHESEGQEMFNFLISADDGNTAIIEERQSVSFSIEDDEPVLHSVVSFLDKDFTASGDSVTLKIKRDEAVYSYVTMGLRTKETGSAVKGDNFPETDTTIALQPFQTETEIEIPVDAGNRELTFEMELYDLKGPDAGDIMTATIHIPAAGSERIPDKSGDEESLEATGWNDEYANKIKIGTTTYDLSYRDNNNRNIAEIMASDGKTSIGQYIAVKSGYMFDRDSGGDSGDREFCLKNDGGTCLYLSYYSSWVGNKGWVGGNYFYGCPVGRYRAVMADIATQSTYDSALAGLEFHVNNLDYSGNKWDGYHRKITIGNKNDRAVRLPLGLYRGGYVPLVREGWQYSRTPWFQTYVKRNECYLTEPSSKTWGFVMLYKEFRIQIEQPDTLQYRSGDIDENGKAKTVAKKPAFVKSATDTTRYYGQDIQMTVTPAGDNPVVLGELTGYNIKPLNGSQFFYATNSTTLTLNDNLVSLIDQHTSKYEVGGTLPYGGDKYVYTTIIVKPVYRYKNVRVEVLPPQGLPDNATVTYKDKELDNLAKKNQGSSDSFHVGDQLNLSMTADVPGYTFSQYWRAQYVNPGDTAWDSTQSGALPVVPGTIPGPYLTRSKCQLWGIFTALPNHIPIKMDADAQKYFTVRDVLSSEELSGTPLKDVDYYVLSIKDEFDTSGEKYEPVAGRAYSVILDETDENRGKYRPVITLGNGKKVQGFAADLIADPLCGNNLVTIKAEAVDQDSYRYFSLTGTAVYSAYALRTGSEKITSSPTKQATITAGGSSTGLYNSSGVLKRSAVRYSTATDKDGRFSLDGLRGIPGDVISIKLDNNDIQQVEYVTLCYSEGVTPKKSCSFDETHADTEQKKNIVQSKTEECASQDTGRIDMPVRTFYSPYVSSLYYGYGSEKNAVDTRLNTVPIYDSDLLSITFSVVKNKAKIKKVTVTKVSRTGAEKDYEAELDQSSDTDTVSSYAADINGSDLADNDHFYVSITAIPDGASSEIKYTSLDTGLVTYTPKEIPPSQYFSYTDLKPVPYEKLPILEDMVSSVDTGKLTWKTVYADNKNKGTSPYAQIVTLAVGTEQIKKSQDKLNAIKNGKSSPASSTWDEMFNNDNTDVYSYLNASDQAGIVEQYQADHPNATEQEAKDYFNSHPDAKGSYRDKFTASCQADALSKSGKMEFSATAKVLLQFEYDYDPDKREHFWSGGQYLINVTGNLKKTFYWAVMGVPVFLNISGNMAVQLDGRYAKQRERILAKELGYYDNLTEKIPTEKPWLQFSLGIKLEPGVGICGVLSARGILSFAFSARVATGKVETGSQGGTIGTFTGGVGVDLVLFSFEYKVELYNWRTGVFKKSGKAKAAGSAEGEEDEDEDGVKMTTGLRSFTNGNETVSLLDAVGSTLFPEEKTTLISGAMEYVRPKTLDLGDGRRMLLFLRNREGEETGSGEKRDSDNASALQYAISKADGSWDRDEKGNIISVTIERDNEADSTLAAMKSGNMVFIAWTNAKVEPGISEDFEAAKKSLESTNIHMTTFNINTNKLGEIKTVTDDDFMNSNIFLAEEKDRVSLYYFKKDLKNAESMDDLVGLNNNYNTWARKVYNPETGEFDKLLPGKANEYEELISIRHPTLTDPMVTDLTVADFDYTDVDNEKKEYRLMSYTVDLNADNETPDDRELWVQVTNLTDDRSYYPIHIDTDDQGVIDPVLTKLADDVYLTWISDYSVYNALSAGQVFRGLDAEDGTNDGAIDEDGKKVDHPGTTRSLERVRSLSENVINRDGWYLEPYKAVADTGNFTSLRKLSECRFPVAQKDFGGTDEQDERYGTTLTDHQIVAGGDGNLYLFWTAPDNDDIENDFGRELYGATIFNGSGSAEDEASEADSDEKDKPCWSDAVKLTEYGKVIDELDVSVAGDKSAVLVGNLYNRRINEDGEVVYSDHEFAEIRFTPGNSLVISGKEIKLSDYYPVPGETVEATVSIENNGLLTAEKYQVTLDGETKILDKKEYVIHPGKTEEIFNDYEIDESGKLTVSAEVRELDGTQLLSLKDEDSNKARVTTKTGAVLDFGSAEIFDTRKDIFGDDYKTFIDLIRKDDTVYEFVKDLVSNDEQGVEFIEWLRSDSYKPSDMVMCIPVTNIGNAEGKNLEGTATVYRYDENGPTELGTAGKGSLSLIPVKTADQDGGVVTKTVYLMIPLTGFDPREHLDDLGVLELVADFTLDGEPLSDTVNGRRQFIENIQLDVCGGVEKLVLAVGQSLSLSENCIAYPWNGLKELYVDSLDDRVVMTDREGTLYAISEGETYVTIYDDYSDLSVTLPVEVSYNPEYTVTFDLNGQGGILTRKHVLRGNRVAEPAAPTADGLFFDGWYTDRGCEDKYAYSFSTPVTSNLTLYAKWVSPQPFDLRFANVTPDEYRSLCFNSDNMHYETVFTGGAVCPEVIVTGADGKRLVEGTDYTISYSNNKAVSSSPAYAVISGKGKYTKKVRLPFYIVKADLSELKRRGMLDIPEAFPVQSGKKLTPVICYGAYILKSSDYSLSDTGKISKDCEVDISGKGMNFTGKLEKMPVKALDQKEVKARTIKVKVAAGQHIYDTNPHTLSGNELLVTAGKPMNALKEYEGYVVSYCDNIEAGKATVTVLGKGDYIGSVKKTFKIKPDTGSDILATLKDPADTCYFSPSGVMPEVTVSSNRGGYSEELRIGKDYRITWSNNRKTGSGNYTVKFQGNYKGHKPVKGNFEIVKAPLGSAEVVAGDLVYTKPDKYHAVPFVSLDGVLLSKKDYTVEYYNGTARLADNEKIELKDGEDVKTITIRVKGTGNCSMETETTYNIIKAGSLTDLTKAKIAAKGSAMKPVGKQGYTGEKLEPPIDVYVKQGAAWTKVDEKFYSVSYINNIEPGTARIVVNGEGNNAVGSASAKFSITKGDFSKIFSGNIK